MSKTLIAIVAFLILCTPGVGHAETLSGTWQLVQKSPDGVETTIKARLKQTGDDITGTIEMPWGDLAIRDGKRQGNKLSFYMDGGHFIGEIEGRHLSLDFVGFDVVTIHYAGTPFISASDAKIAPITPPLLQSVRPNGLAPTPPMGWSSWNHFHAEIDDATVRQIADALVTTGMRDAGYTYVNIDDSWQGYRDEAGQLHPNKKFPDMKALGDYVHAKGLKLGLYSSPGPTTCAGYIGSYGHEQQDATTFASWDIDYLKYDWCSAFRLYEDKDMRAVYQKMGDALSRLDHPIVYSLCQYGKADVWQWGRLVGGNLWRTTQDIQNNYSDVAQIAERQIALAKWSGPGGWNDPDMLEVGNGHLTAAESRAHMTMWAMLKAPLIAGNDIRSLDDETRMLLTDREVIAIDRDKGTKPPMRIYTKGNIEVWIRTLSDGSSAIAFFNSDPLTKHIRVAWSTLGFAVPPRARNVWRKSTLKKSSFILSALPSHDVLLIRTLPRTIHSPLVGLTAAPSRPLLTVTSAHPQ